VVLLILGLNPAVIGWDVVQGQIPAVDFVHKYENVFAFKSVIFSFCFDGTQVGCSQTFLKHLDSVAATCNYAEYMKDHVTYPPRGLLPLPGASTEFDPGCDVWDEIFNAALIVNPSFNMYRIFDTVSLLL
jgi:carboxypeptidase D